MCFKYNDLLYNLMIVFECVCVYVCIYICYLSVPILLKI